MRPYFSKFLDEIVRQKGHKQFALFFNCLLPAIDGDLSHVRRLEQILMDFPNEEDFNFQEVLLDGICRLNTAHQIRQEAAKLEIFYQKPAKTLK